MYQYTSVERIFSKLTREKVSFDEDTVIEQVGEALAFIGTATMLEEAVAFAEVKNNQCTVPRYALSIIQIGRNNRWTPTTPCVTPQTVIEEAPNIFYQTCTDCGGETSVDLGYVVLDGRGTPLVEYDIAYYRPYFNLRAEYEGWSNSQSYRGNYTPIRLANSSFFNSIVDPQHDGALYSNCRDEYSLVGGNSVLRFSFNCGFVAIAYKRPLLDPKTGYPMIPESQPHITAITSYVKKMEAEIDFRKRREGSKEVLEKYERDWDWYCGQASNLDKMPDSLDELQNLLDQRSYLLPDHNKYNNFFGNLSTPEYRKFNDPDHRNNTYNTYIR